MTNVSVMLGVPNHALPAWSTLSAALDRLAAEGRTPVCARRPDDWASEAPASTRREAAEACSYCAVQPLCAAFAEAAEERHGVWGGVDRGLRPTKRSTNQEEVAA